MPRTFEKISLKLEKKELYAILFIEKDNFGSIRERQIQGNLEAQSRAPRSGGVGRLPKKEEFRDLSRACSAWDFFSEIPGMPRTERQKMLRIPRSSRFLVIENDKNPFDMCEMDTDRNKLIFTRIMLISKQPFIVRIARVEKEVITK